MAKRWIVGWLGVILLQWGCAFPTGPSKPEIVFHGATADQEASGRELWTEIKECVGYDGSRSHGFPVYVVSQPLICGDIIAAGCYEPHRIRVVGDEPSWYLLALGNEFIHYALQTTWRSAVSVGRNPEDWANHDAELFVKCDWRRWFSLSLTPEGEVYDYKKSKLPKDPLQ